MTEKSWLLASEVAQMFRVDRKTVTRWAAAGRLPSFQTPGGQYRFDVETVGQILDAGFEPSTWAPTRKTVTFDDGLYAVFRYDDGEKTGAAWGPAAGQSQDWFVYRDDRNNREAWRVESRDHAVAILKEDS